MPFRASRSTRSGRPGVQADHDMFAGLPVRQWRVQDTVIGATDDEASNQHASTLDQEFATDETPEMPMPKGSEQYQPWIHKLLRAARAGRLYTRAQTENGSSHGVNGTGAGNGKGESDKENAGRRGDNNNKEEEDEVPRGTKRSAPQGFVAKRWMLLSKTVEEPERDRLAKRRKGLPPVHAAGVVAAGVPTRKTKVRRTDADGQVTVWEVIVPEGQVVEGEIQEDVTLESAGAAIAAPKPGTVVEGLGVANEDGIVVASEAIAPPRRKGAVAQRKKKKGGPGRWQKKAFETTGKGVSASAEEHEARKAREKARQEQNGGEGGQLEGEGEGDQTMSENQAEDVYDEGEGEEEEGEEGDEDPDREDGELTPTPDPEQKLDEPSLAIEKDERSPVGDRMLDGPAETAMDVDSDIMTNEPVPKQQLPPPVELPATPRKTFKIPGLGMTPPPPRLAAVAPPPEPEDATAGGARETTEAEEEDDEEEYEPPEWSGPVHALSKAGDDVPGGVPVEVRNEPGEKVQDQAPPAIPQVSVTDFSALAADEASKMEVDDPEPGPAGELPPTVVINQRDEAEETAPHEAEASISSEPILGAESVPKDEPAIQDEPTPQTESTLGGELVSNPVVEEGAARETNLLEDPYLGDEDPMVDPIPPAEQDHAVDTEGRDSMSIPANIDPSINVEIAAEAEAAAKPEMPEEPPAAMQIDRDTLMSTEEQPLPPPDAASAEHEYIGSRDAEIQHHLAADPNTEAIDTAIAENVTVEEHHEPEPVEQNIAAVIDNVEDKTPPIPEPAPEPSTVSALPDPTSELIESTEHEDPSLYTPPAPTLPPQPDLLHSESPTPKVEPSQPETETEPEPVQSDEPLQSDPDLSVSVKSPPASPQRPETEALTPTPEPEPVPTSYAAHGVGRDPPPTSQPVGFDGVVSIGENGAEESGAQEVDGETGTES